MKLAGPPAMMEVLLLTNRPAPMIPPMEIIVKWRPFSERLSTYLGAVGEGGLVWLILFPFMIFREIFGVICGLCCLASRSGRGSPSFGTVARPQSCRSRIQGSG